MDWRFYLAPPFLCRESPLIRRELLSDNGRIDKCQTYNLMAKALQQNEHSYCLHDFRHIKTAEPHILWNSAAN